MKSISLKQYRIALLLGLSLLALTTFSSCNDDDDIDKQVPAIDLSSIDAFPVNCDTLYFGESFQMRILFSDNAELGANEAFSIDIHNNFDHHSHSTEVTECDLDPEKDPVNPLTLMMNFDIPAGLQEYETDITMDIPEGDGNGPYDDGDYHFFISLSDKEGWSAQKGLSIKMMHR